MFGVWFFFCVFFMRHEHIPSPGPQNVILFLWGDTLMEICSAVTKTKSKRHCSRLYLSNGNSTVIFLARSHLPQTDPELRISSRSFMKGKITNSKRHLLPRWKKKRRGGGKTEEGEWLKLTMYQLLAVLMWTEIQRRTKEDCIPRAHLVAKQEKEPIWEQRFQQKNQVGNEIPVRAGTLTSHQTVLQNMAILLYHKFMKQSWHKSSGRCQNYFLRSIRCGHKT